MAKSSLLIIIFSYKFYGTTFAREDVCKIEHDISKDSINASKVALKK